MTDSDAARDAVMVELARTASFLLRATADHAAMIGALLIIVRELAADHQGARADPDVLRQAIEQLTQAFQAHMSRAATELPNA